MIKNIIIILLLLPLFCFSQKVNVTGNGTVVSSVLGNPSGLVNNSNPQNPVIQQDVLKLNISDTLNMLANYLLTGIANATFQTLSNKVTSLDNSSTHYPSTSAVTTAIGTKQNANSSYVYLEDYGGVGDSTTGNYAAFTAAIAALPARGGVIRLGAGIYKLDTSVAVTKTLTIEGVGAWAKSGSYEGATKIYTTSGTINLFYVTNTNFQFRNIYLINTATTPTAGSGIKITGDGSGFKIERCWFDGFYNNMDVVRGYLWNIDKCFFGNAVANELKIRDSTLPDDGDAVISSSVFTCYRNDTAINQSSGGGLNVVNTKFNGGTFKFKYCYYGNFTEGATSNLSFQNCSLENMQNGIFLAGNSHFTGKVRIGNCEFLSNFTGSTDITISSVTGVSILGCIFKASNASNTAINLNTVTDASLSANTYTSYTTPNSFTASQSALIGTNAQIALVSGTKAITISGLSTTSRAMIQLVSQSGAASTVNYTAACTSNTLTITAVTSAGNNTTNTSDVSTVNYLIVN